MAACILALETSTDTCGVALLREHGGEPHIALREHQGVAAHSGRILPMIDEVLSAAGVRRADVDAIAFGQGPGGFTGLRVACGVAQGLGFALERPLLPVTSHRAIEAQLPSAGAPLRAIVIDARMREAYVALYRRAESDVVEVQAPVLIAFADLPAWLARQWPQWDQAPMSADTLRVAGDWGDCADVAHSLPPGCLVPGTLRARADAVARIGLADLQAGRAIAPDLAQPLYVRDKVAFTTRERAAGAGGNPRAAGVA